MNKGDIVYISWGYDQTNVDFYEGIDKSGKATFTLNEIGKKLDPERDDEYADYVLPVPEKKIGEPFKKRLNKNGDFKIHSFAWTSAWNGESKYETPFGMGH